MIQESLNYEEYYELFVYLFSIYLRYYACYFDEGFFEKKFIPASLHWGQEGDTRYEYRDVGDYMLGNVDWNGLFGNSVSSFSIRPTDILVNTFI